MPYAAEILCIYKAVVSRGLGCVKESKMLARWADPSSFILPFPQGVALMALPGL
jgi:hypothetical protein